MSYIIYCDLDGVLVDFAKGYFDLTGTDYSFGLAIDSISNIYVTILMFILHFIYIICTKNFHSNVSSCGNLIWDFKISRILFWIWVFLLLFSFLYEQKWGHLLFAVITFSIFIYKNIFTAGSMWCWFINSISIYLAIKLLFYLPFLENKQIC